MAVRRIEDSTLAAVADAIREKTGSTASMKVGDMPAAIAAIEGGGGLPAKMAVGSFTCPDEYTALGNFTIEHGLGTVPQAVLVWNTAGPSNKIITGMVCFSHESVCTLYAGTTPTQVTGSIASALTETTFLVPSPSGSSASSSVWIGTYNWAAIGE